MSSFLVDISASIKAKMESLSGIKTVVEFEPDKPQDGKYPFMSITPRSFTGEFGDTKRNLRSLIFAVRVYQERTQIGFGNEKSERVMRELSDEIITAFDNDTTLSGLVKFVRPITGDFDFIERETGDTRILEILLEANVVVDSIT